MKKRFLPFTFFLSLVALALVLNASNPYDGSKGVVVNKNNSVQNELISSNYFNLVRNNQHSGLINPQLVVAASVKTDLLNSSRSVSNIDWNVVGPDNAGGRTRALLYDNTDASGNTIYAGAVTGGMWKSSDNGITWDKINSANENLFVSCITQDSEGALYVGTGEMFFAEGASQLGQLGYSNGFMGSGIYKSTDGNNFELIESTKPEANTPSVDWDFINEIQVDANGRIYAATNTGLKFSDDQGASWQMAKDTAGNELTGNSYDVKTAGSFVVASVDNQCYTSVGDALQFVSHSTGEVDQLPLKGEIRRAEFAIAPSDNSVVYVSLINNNGYLKGVYRSGDSGATWQVVLPETNSLMIFFGAGEYFNTLVVFPDNPNKVLLGGHDLWLGYKTNDTGLFFWEQKSSTFGIPGSANILAGGNHVYAFRPNHPTQLMIGTSSGIYKGEFSDPDFLSQPANRKYYTTQFYRVACSGIENYTIGGAQENGILKITGETNSPGYSTQIYGNGALGGDVAISLINPDVIVYGGYGGSVLRSEDRGENVSTQFLTGDITNANAAITPVAIWESFNNENSRDSIWYHAREDIAAGSTIKVRSSNSGYPFNYTLSDDSGLQDGDSVEVVDPISSRLFIAVDGGVFMTKELHNFGKTPEWFQIANGAVGFAGMPNTIAYSSDANHLWVGTIDGKVYRISNLALAYNKALADVNEPTCIVANSMFQITDPETGNLIDQAVTSISVDPQDPTKVLVTFGNYGNANYVFYTENALDQSPLFESKQGNLPEMPVYSSLIEMSDENTVILGTENGIFTTENIMSNLPAWTFNSDQMGKVPVFDLKQQTVPQASVTLTVIAGMDTSDIVYPGATNYGIVYAGTYGRGIYKTSTYRKPLGIEDHNTENGNTSKGSLKVYPNPATNTIYFELNVKISSTADVLIYNQAGLQVKATVVSLNKGDSRGRINISDLPTGSYIIRVRTGNKISTQKFVKL